MPAALPQSEQELLGYGVCNIAKELWDKTGTGWTSLQRRSGQSFLLISAGMEPVAAAHFGEELGLACKTMLKQSVKVSPAVSSSILGLCSTADALEQWETSLHKESQSPEEARIRHWKTLLLQEDAQTVQAEITTELNRLSLKAAQERMQWIAQTLIQALHCTLQERGCPEATELVEAKPVFESLPQFLSWVQGNLARTERLLRHSPGEEQVIRRIKEYIELNIHQELTRENIAAAVYLNPDYTARLFKRKTGQSLNDYIQNKRINLARQLLAGTDMPVGDLAVALGYSSFSHFTKLFKSIEGVTPSDYRKQHARMPG